MDQARIRSSFVMIGWVVAKRLRERSAAISNHPLSRKLEIATVVTRPRNDRSK